MKNPNEFGWKTQKENTWKNVIKFLITDYLFILRRKNQIQTNYIHLILLFFFHSFTNVWFLFTFVEKKNYFTFLFQNVPFENDEKEIWKGVFLIWKERLNNTTAANKTSSWFVWENIRKIKRNDAKKERIACSFFILSTCFHVKYKTDQISSISKWESAILWRCLVFLCVLFLLKLFIRLKKKLRMKCGE